MVCMLAWNARGSEFSSSVKLKFFLKRKWNVCILFISKVWDTFSLHLLINNLGDSLITAIYVYSIHTSQYKGIPNRWQ